MIEINNITKQKIDKKKIALIGEEFLSAYHLKKAVVSVAIVGDLRMRRLNLSYRGQDKTTDVLSFSNSEFKSGSGLLKKNAEYYLGEIVINSSALKKLGNYEAMFEELNFFSFGHSSSRLQKKQADYLFYFIFVHGLLHLSGLNDEKEAARLDMLQKGKKFLTGLGIEMEEGEKRREKVLKTA